MKKAEAINAAHMRLLPIEEIDQPRAALPQAGAAWSATRSATPTRSSSSWRCRWSPSGSTSSPRPSTCWASCFVDESGLHPRPTRSTTPDATSSRRRTTRSSGLSEWTHGRDRGGAARRARRRARAQAAQRVRAGARRRHRPQGLAAAVRVAGAARPRAEPRPARRRRGVSRPMTGRRPGRRTRRSRRGCRTTCILLGGRRGWWRYLVGIAVVAGRPDHRGAAAAAAAVRALVPARRPARRSTA